MEAGRELDALVAEKVMQDIPGQALGPRHYSTNIADAWEVVHKLREGNLWFVIKQDNSSGWEAKFWKGLPDGWFPTEEYYAVALTPALAICLAALKAKGVTGEQHG